MPYLGTVIGNGKSRTYSSDDNPNASGSLHSRNGIGTRSHGKIASQGGYGRDLRNYVRKPRYIPTHVPTLANSADDHLQLVETGGIA